MLILHHYDMSPFSEKIRLMLGYSGIPWQSLISPEMPPRANIDPLSGGYRRIPIAQIGADIFCDSRLISTEISRLSGIPALDLHNGDKDCADYCAHLEGDIFWASVLSMGAGVTIKQLLRNIGVWKTLRFMKDRIGVGRAARVALPTGKQAAQTYANHLEDLQQRLQEDFLSGESPSYQDFAAYHTVWFHRFVAQLSLPVKVPLVDAWYQRMSGFGHGNSTDITQNTAFAAARDNAPAKIPAADTADPMVGSQVIISPADYALNGVQGTLAGCSKERWILARDTSEFGLLHVHFPRSGFNLKEAASS